MSIDTVFPTEKSAWSSGMIPALGAGGPGFKPRSGPFLLLSSLFRTEKHDITNDTIILWYRYRYRTVATGIVLLSYLWSHGNSIQDVSKRIISYCKIVIYRDRFASVTVSYPWTHPSLSKYSTYVYRINNNISFEILSQEWRRDKVSFCIVILLCPCHSNIR